MSITAMKQALEALEEAHPKPYNESVISHVEAITALRTAIEQAEKQEPVAWLYQDSWGTLKLSQIMPPPIGAFPVYTTPPAQEFVCSTGMCHYKAHGYIKGDTRSGLVDNDFGEKI